MDVINELISSLYFSEYSKLLQYAKIMLKDTEAAEDAVQEVFCVALLRSDILVSHPNPKGWLMQTLKYTICNFNRSRSQYLLRFVAIDPQILKSKSIDSSKPPIDEDTILLIAKQALSPEEYLLLRRIVFEKIDYATVSDELKITVPACYKRLERVRKKLHKLFKQYLSEY